MNILQKKKNELFFKNKREMQNDTKKGIFCVNNLCNK